jgi:hypothetical protein
VNFFGGLSALKSSMYDGEFARYLNSANIYHQLFPSEQEHLNQML